LILDGDKNHTGALLALVRAAGYEASAVATVDAARKALKDTRADVVFIALDPSEEEDGLRLLRGDGGVVDALDGAEIIIMGEHDDPERADQAIRLGASYFFCKPFDEQNLASMLRDIAAEIASLEIPASSEDNSQPCVVDQFGFLRGSSRSMRKLYRLIRKVAHTDASVLVHGESGTGKELVARTVHTLSERAEGPFVAINCAAVAENLMESELFGHEKGSFSGADKRHHGFFERATGGTLLLDEITEMDIDLQAKLLRVLETGKLMRVGSEQEIDFDVRIISSTNRSPEEAVEKGQLREDLYYRLAQFPIHLPALRNREGDIGGLAQYFLNELNAHHETELRFSTEASRLIGMASWPGNVRQLKHAVERAYIVSNSVIEADAFELSRRSANGITSSSELVEIPVGTSLADSERELILATLEQNSGDKSATAEQLGISLKTLYNRLNGYEEMVKQE